MYKLGVCYEKRLGVPMSLEEALKWFRKAAEKGDGPSKRKLEELG